MCSSGKIRKVEMESDTDKFIKLYRRIMKLSRFRNLIRLKCSACLLKWDFPGDWLTFLTDSARESFSSHT